MNGLTSAPPARGRGWRALSLPMILVAAWPGLTGCSNKAIYDNLQLHRRNECLKEPPPTQDTCIDRTKVPYEDYQRAREEVLESRPSRSFSR